MYESQSIKYFFKSWYVNLFVIEKVKDTTSWTYVTEILNDRNPYWNFLMKKNCKGQNKQCLEMKKYLKKGSSFYVKWMDMIIYLIIELMLMI